jgi:hypothetical protein
MTEDDWKRESCESMVNETARRKGRNWNVSEDKSDEFAREGIHSGGWGIQYKNQ